MTKLSPSLVKTWLFYLDSTDLKLEKSKLIALKNIELHFGNTEMAKLYVEQNTDKDIEVVLL